MKSSTLGPGLSGFNSNNNVSETINGIYTCKTCFIMCNKIAKRNSARLFIRSKNWKYAVEIHLSYVYVWNFQTSLMLSHMHYQNLKQRKIKSKIFKPKTKLNHNKSPNIKRQQAYFSAKKKHAWRTLSISLPTVIPVWFLGLSFSQAFITLSKRHGPLTTVEY